MPSTQAIITELLYAYKQAGPAGKLALSRVLANVGMIFQAGEWRYPESSYVRQDGIVLSVCERSTDSAL